MTAEPLNLIFPQWQGSGFDNALFHGARALSGICPKLSFTTVPVPETCTLETRHGILGYDHILSQMKAAGALIEKAAPETILTIGGDCGVEVMPVSWLNRLHHGRMTVVWLDAHGDLNTPETSPSGHFHGMPLAGLLGMGDPTLCSTALSHISVDQIILAGLRNPDPAEAELAKKMTLVSVEAMERAPGCLGTALREKGNAHIYLHIDLDVLDPGRFPHVGCPEPAGLMPGTLIRIVKELADEFSIAGLGLMEFTLPGPGEDSPSYIKRLIDIFR